MISRLKSLRDWFAQRTWRRWILRAAVVGFGVGLFWQLAIALTPLPVSIAEVPSRSPQIVDRHGEPLRMIRHGENHFFTPVQLGECAPAFIQATLAAEDKRFWAHDGIDWLGVLRAARDSAANGRIVSGASTITQQLIKNADPRPRTIRTKLIEWLQACKLERRWSKEQILAAYLNRIDYGNLCRGGGTAAWFYFDKPLADVSPAEAAFLAGLPNAPGRFNPHRHFDRAKRRQQTILHRMHRNGWLSAEALRRALAEPIALHPAGRAFAAEHFVDFLNQQQIKDGIAQTTLDLSLNQFAHRALNHRLERLADKNVSNGAVVVIENATGKLRAMVGSRNYFEAKSGQVNGAWAPRSAGSTFKPFTYLLALELGMTPATVIADVPAEFATSTGIFSPQNFDHRFAGPVSIRHALANSLNVPAVKVLDQIGGAKVLQIRLRQCGLTTLNAEAAHYGLGLTIGNAEARLLELANAYATLARLGVHRPVRLFESDAGEPTRVFDAARAWLLAGILADNRARAAVFGWDSALAFEFPVACKTGTSSDFRDNWAFGFTPEFTVGVWVGNFDGSPTRQITGATGAAPVMHKVMLELRKRFGTGWYSRPAEIASAKVHPLTGKISASGESEWFIRGQLPPVQPAGPIQLGGEYAQWFASRHNHLRGQVTLAPAEALAVKVVSPLPGTVFYLDGDLPESSQWIPLRATREVNWQSDSLQCEFRENGIYARLRPGRHRLTARVNGRQLKTWIDVEQQ